MVILITGASHTGKTLLSLRLIERTGFPCLSVDHLKMGLIRSGRTTLTPEDDKELTPYLWSIVVEMIKTAIENRQNLIVEGCYVPFNWKNDLSAEYLSEIRFFCLAMTQDYIEKHFCDIRKNACAAEKRLDDSYFTVQIAKRDNAAYLAGFKGGGDCVIEISDNYDADGIADGIIQSL